jgi:hypothetical protein
MTKGSVFQTGHNRCKQFWHEDIHYFRTASLFDWHSMVQANKEILVDKFTLYISFKCDVTYDRRKKQKMN